VSRRELPEVSLLCVSARLSRTPTEPAEDGPTLRLTLAMTMWVVVYLTAAWLAG